ncbi:MAG: hypothetical protein AB1626_01060, partial [Candidatus Micrarchaeota archaeon]
MGLLNARQTTAIALLLLVLVNLAAAPPSLPSIADRYCLNSPWMSHPSAWHSMANQITQIDSLVVNSPLSGSSFEYGDQPIDLEVVAQGSMTGYGISVQEATSTTQLGVAANNSAARFALPRLAAGSHLLQVNATASLRLCSLRHSKTRTAPLSLIITKSTPAISITITPDSPIAPGTESRAECASSTPQALPQLLRNGAPVTNPDVATLPLGTYEYTCTASETQNYTSASATPATLVVDARTPTTTSVTINGVDADATITYSESATLAATTSAGSLILYLNGTPIANPTTAVLAAGTYNVTAVNPGDIDHFPSSATRWLTVSKATLVLTLTASPSDTVTYGTPTSVSCAASTPQATPQLTRDSTSVTNPDAATLGAGTYAYACSAAETQNYTAAAATPLTLTVNAVVTTTTVTINGADADQTINYGTPATLAATTSAGSLTLYLNGTPITNPSTLTLAAGYYNVTATNAGDANHFPSTATHWLTVNKAIPTLVLTINGADADATIEAGTSATITATLSIVADVGVTENGTGIATGPSPQTVVRTPAIGTYNYTATFAGNTDYSSASASHLVTVRDSTFPQIAFVAPTPATAAALNTDVVTVNASMTGGDSAGMEWTFSNGTTANISLTCAGGYCSTQLIDLRNGTHSYRAWATEASGNSNTTETRTLTVPPFVRVATFREGRVQKLAVFNGALYAGTARAGAIYHSTDGVNWTQVFNGSAFGITYDGIFSFAVWNSGSGDALYAGTGGPSYNIGKGDVYKTRDGTTWTLALNTSFGSAPPATRISALEVFDGRLFAALTHNVSAGRIIYTNNDFTWYDDTLTSTGALELQASGSNFYAGIIGSRCWRNLLPGWGCY